MISSMPSTSCSPPRRHPATLLLQLAPGWLLALALASMFALLTPQVLHAAEVCSSPDQHGVAHCRAGLTTAQIRHMAVAQEKSQWCWAASIAMVFAHHGYKLEQE